MSLQYRERKQTNQKKQGQAQFGSRLEVVVGDEGQDRLAVSEGRPDNFKLTLLWQMCQFQHVTKTSGDTRSHLEKKKMHVFVLTLEQLF